MEFSNKSCPVNSFQVNSTLCACNPGYLLESSSKNCTLFRSSASDWSTSSGVDTSSSFFPATLLAFDSIKNFTQSQAVFLEATLVMLVSWILFCVLIRFRKVQDGRSIWFKIRWWISRLDFCFATRHWLEDHKVVRKRKTELGGTFSIASWILFVGLFAALLYQIISKRTVEVHNLRATNAPDLFAFVNDMEFNITTVSSMSCSHLRGLGTLVSGTPGFIDYRVSPLSVFVNYSCHNTSLGPTINLRCNNCHITHDDLYVSWQFVDLPNDPASAVGFQFNFTAKNRNYKHVSFVTGTLQNGSSLDARPVSFRGPDGNIFKFHLFPRHYRNHHDLRLIQPLFHEFLPGSSFLGRNELQASLQNGDGLINTTLFLNFLSAYIVEIDNANILGPVGFFADLGGLYAISFAFFYYCLVQCEYRFKKLRDEDSVLGNIRNRTRAQENWEKLRKYVMYTWGCSILDDNNVSIGEDALCCCAPVETLRNGSLHKRKQPSRMDSINLSKSVKLPVEMKAVPKSASTEKVKSSLGGSAAKRGLGSASTEKVKSSLGGSAAKCGQGSHERGTSQPQVSTPNDSTLPLPPDLEYKSDSGSDISDIRKNLQNLFEYNVMLREKFIAAQSMLEALTKQDSTSHSTSIT